MRFASLLPAVLLTLALAGCQPANPGLGWKAYTPEAPDFMVFDLSEDGTKDASAMGTPLKRR